MGYYSGKNRAKESADIKAGNLDAAKANELKRFNFTRLEIQSNQADRAFHLVRAYLDGNTAELNPSPVLKKISAPPPSN